MCKWLLILLCLLTGCSAVNTQKERFVPARPVTSIITDTISSTADGVWAAARTPFTDLNLTRQEIPLTLQRAALNPYALPAQMLCEGIRREIAELDAVLSPDVCTLENPTGISRKGEYVEDGAGYAKKYAVDLVGDKVSIIPFRSAVRRLTGAEKHAKAVDRAYQAGNLRRAFLKGIAISLGPDCMHTTGSTSSYKPD